MTYVKSRGLPWHGLGTPADDLMTAEQALENGGLNWNVSLQQLALASNPGIILPQDFATVRDTDSAVLGVVGRQYQVIQNRDAFEFADRIVDDGSAKYETAGSLRGGQVVFLSMELNGLNILVNGERPEGMLKAYLLVSTTHDGSGPLRGDITMVRTVCSNTLNLAKQSASQTFKIRHSGTIDGKIAAARQALGIAFEYTRAFEENANRLAATSIVDAQVQDIFRNYVWPLDEDATDGRIENHPSTRAFEVYQTADDLAPIRGTAWGALNAVADYVDHGIEYRGRYEQAESIRANSILWGTARDKKQRAFDALMKVAVKK